MERRFVMVRCVLSVSAKKESSVLLFGRRDEVAQMIHAGSRMSAAAHGIAPK
jgi:hypothetical protein